MLICTESFAGRVNPLMVRMQWQLISVPPSHGSVSIGMFLDYPRNVFYHLHWRGCACRFTTTEGFITSFKGWKDGDRTVEQVWEAPYRVDAKMCGFPCRWIRVPFQRLNSHVNGEDYYCILGMQIKISQRKFFIAKG